MPTNRRRIVGGDRPTETLVGATGEAAHGATSAYFLSASGTPSRSNPFGLKRSLNGGPPQDAGPEAVLEHEAGLGTADDAVPSDVLQHPITQRLGVRDGDVQVDVVGAGEVEGLPHAGRPNEIVVQRGDELAAVTAEPDLDDGLQRAPSAAGSTTNRRPLITPASLMARIR